MQNDKESTRLNAEVSDKGFVSQLMRQIRKMQLKDWKNLFLLGLSFIPGKAWKLLNRHLWVVSEYEGLARDNGYWFFKYIRDNYPDKSVFYPIAKGASDEGKIDVLGNRINFASFKHYMLFWAAEKQFTSSKNAGFPSRICEDLVQWRFHRFQYVMLNHGITKGKSTVVDASKTNFDYILTCSELDREIIIKDNNQPEDKVLSIGFARHDNLDNSMTDKRTILVMPTWRTYVNIKFCRSEEEKKQKINEFLTSDYYKKYGLDSYDTGGYTGTWDNTGRLAFLHQKELVLNADDTSNILKAVSAIRDLTSLNGSISSAIATSIGSMAMNLVANGGGNINTNSNSNAENQFYITAEFPNANDVETIREAILSLPNLASQYIHKNK